MSVVFFTQERGSEEETVGISLGTSQLKYVKFIICWKAAKE